MSDTYNIWLVIVILGLGTFMIRFSFIGLIGNRQFPEWILRLLRYTGVSILPALVAPAVYFSNAGETAPDPARLMAAIVTISIGLITRSIMGAMITGAISLITLQYFLT